MRLLFALVVVLAFASYARGADEPLEVRIVAGRFTQRGALRIGEETNANKLHVVITNTSDAQFSIFDQGNGWGYGNLTFTLEFFMGEKVELKRIGGFVWHHNAPELVVLQPGDMYVFEVWLTDEKSEIMGRGRTNAWGPVRLAGAEERLVTLQAHYEVGDTEHPFDSAVGKQKAPRRFSSEPVKLCIGSYGNRNYDDAVAPATREEHLAKRSMGVGLMYVDVAP